MRADNGLGVPAVYDFCEAEGLPYAIGYATNPVLQRATAQALADLELYHHFYGHREPLVQRFEEIRDYQAETWPRPRRIVAKVEVTPQGSQRRFVVTNLPEPAGGGLPGLLRAAGGGAGAADRGDEERLARDRLSACGFCANAFRLLVHAVAYAIVVLFREAAAAVPEVATASVGTLRQRLWKVGAVVVTGARRVWLHVSETWPYRELWPRVQAAVQAFGGQVARVAVRRRPARRRGW